MKHITFSVFIILITFLILSCNSDLPTSTDMNQNPDGTFAKKPEANLIGEMSLKFDVFAVWPEEPVWVGTVTFEDYGMYGMRFFHLSEFKGYSQASPFVEHFEIFDMQDPQKIYLAGPDVGVTTTANKPPEDCPYRMNGEIDQALAPFEEWLGRHVHMSGMISWQFLTLPDGTEILVPNEAPGTFRIN